MDDMKSRGELRLTSEVRWATTKSDGMWDRLLEKGVYVAAERKPGMFLYEQHKQGVTELLSLGIPMTPQRILPLRMSVSYDQRRLSGGRFSQTLVAVQSEKRVSSMGFENHKLLNLRCTGDECLSCSQPLGIEKRASGHPQSG